MNRDFFQFPSWVVAELNKQAQPKSVEDLNEVADRMRESTIPIQKQALARSEMEGIQAPKRKGRPAGSKNKPKAK